MKETLCRKIPGILTGINSEQLLELMEENKESLGIAKAFLS